MKKISLDIAYATGFKTVLNNFSFFMFSSTFAIVTTLVHMIVTDLIDVSDLTNKMSLFLKGLHSSLSIVHFGPAHVHHLVSKMLPSGIVDKVFGTNAFSLQIVEHDLGKELIWIVAGSILLKFIFEIIAIGWTKIALDLNSGKKVSESYFIKYYYLAPRVFIVNCCVGLITILGLLLFIVPGIMVYQRLRFARYFIIDKNLSIIKSFQSSWAMTRGYFKELFGFTLIAILFESITNVLFVATLFLTPMHSQVEAAIYLQLVSK